MTILRLPPDVAAKIAAGEVVERPANAAKELIENSIDAGAREIRVEIREGGQRLLRIIDDGCGIPSAEIALSLERHATSKVRCVEDLEKIQTFGFRGEALYSIAAVSQLTISSRHQSEEFGTQLRVEGGVIVNQSRAGLPVGTIISVEQLFYNVPARKKYLRQATTEAGHIRSMVQRAALVHPDRRFSLIIDGKMVFQSTGSGDPIEVLAKIYTLEEARQMVPLGKSKGDRLPPPEANLPDEIDFMDDVGNLGGDTPVPTSHFPVIVSGYVSLPVVTRANRSYIDLFVNRRPIEDRSLGHAVVQAYHTLLPGGRYPIAAIFVEVDPSQIDVNVHPRKSEVRFLQARQVFSEVQKAVRRAVVESATVPGLALSHTAPSSLPQRTVENIWTPRPSQPLVEPAEPQSSGAEQTRLEQTRPEQEEMGFFVPPHQRESHPREEVTQRRQAESRAEPGAQTPEPAPPPQTVAAPQRAIPKLPPLRVVGQIGAMYIVAEGPEGLYLIDQHAAHERIMYEKFMTERFGKGIARQGLLEPLMLHVGDERAGLVAEHLDKLAAVGFDIEAFGGDSFRVRSIPSALSEGDAQRVLDEILQGLAQERNLVGEEIEAQLVKMVCKRASVKAGQVLSDIEMKELLRQLEECQSPRTCPHGRPTMIQLSSNELEKAFKRT
jgi:DNA mismatch repair protein MutL